MRFIDRVRILVRAGDGGDGATAWRREAHEPRGGPAGGDGGRGGSVVLRADDGMTTLLDLKYQQHYKAKPGGRGGSKQKYGKGADDLIIKVPVGTTVYFEGEAGEPGEKPPWMRGSSDDEGMEIIYVADDDEIELFEGELERRTQLESLDEQRDWEPGDTMGDLTEHDARLTVARGGRGGRGNIHFRTSTNRAPDRSEPGRPGEAYWIRLELKLLADVGIVGFPNVGKSTLIRKISRSQAEVGAYPFTTLVPQLGVVELPGMRSFVAADVPGLVKGASEGRGLGHAFLRHLERTRVLLHVLAPDHGEGREPLADLDALEHELASYGEMFEGRPRVVALNKIDTPEGDALLQDTKRALRRRNIPLFPICAQTGEGVDRLLEALWRRLEMVRGREQGEDT